MNRAQLVSMFSRGWMTGRAAFTSVAILVLLAAPGRSPAQDSGVSGIAPGPANARGPGGKLLRMRSVSFTGSKAGVPVFRGASD